MFPYVDAASMFFAGLILLIPHRIGMSRVNYVIKRYNLPISRAGLLLYKYHNNIELSLLCGTFPMVVIIIIIADYYGNDKNKQPIRILMIIFLFFMLLSSIYMFILYISGGDFGHLNSFYFSLIFLTFFDGFANACAFAINGKFSSLLSAGIPLSGFLVTLLHYVSKFFYDLFLWDDFDYYVLRLQLICNIIIISICLLLWIDDTKTNWVLPIKLSSGNLGNLFNRSRQEGQSGSKNDANKNNTWDWSPILLLAISLGTVYAFYPSIAPYSIIDFQYASIIELWILIISAIIPFLIALLDLITVINFDKNPNDTPFILGPSGLLIVAWESSTDNGSGGNATNCHTYTNLNTTSRKKKELRGNWVNNPNNSSNPRHRWWWNLIWLCAIFYILCIQIFMSLLHYPHSSLSCFFNNPRRIQFISILFNTLRELMQALGFAGAGKQVYGSAKGAVGTSIPACPRTSGNHSADCKKFSGHHKWQNNPDDNDYKESQIDGVIAPCNKLFTLFVMMFCVFTGDGYLQHYRRCCRDYWPTTGYNKYQSFFYWLHFGFKGGIKSITSSFTDLYYHNLRPQFISYA